MASGKSICKTLKSIRKQIADSNGIAYTPSECTFSGECTGTCPNCERERQYLERHLSSKLEAGKALKIVSIVAGLSAMVACQKAQGQNAEEDSSFRQEFRWDSYPFHFNGELRPEDDEQWVEMAEFISEFPDDTFLVVGHTDERRRDGQIEFDDQFKLKLSEKRAECTRSALVARGVDPAKIKSVGCGMKEPVIPNAQECGEHEQNNRATLEFYSAKRLKEIQDKTRIQKSKRRK
ncbi:MAG: OmpA family protein [Paludibacteraceae bacterium]|nr:OmpA family protein [Paludibacteraceae bacterium]